MVQDVPLLCPTRDLVPVRPGGGTYLVLFAVARGSITCEVADVVVGT